MSGTVASFYRHHNVTSFDANRNVMGADVVDALEHVREFLGLSLPEFETALARADVKRLLEQRVRNSEKMAWSPSAADQALRNMVR